MILKRASTSRPWFLDDEGDVSALSDGEPAVVAECVYVADSDLIVRAVNAHDAYVEMARTVERMANDMEFCAKGPLCESEIRASMVEHVETLRAALAKAGVA